LKLRGLEGQHIAVLGGGLIGCETAEYLVHNFGKSVEIFEMRDDIAVDLVHSRRKFLLQRIRQQNIKVHTNTLVKEIALPDITIEKEDDTHTLTGFDGAVIALGRRANATLHRQIKQEFGDRVFLLGDAKNPSLAINAIEDSAETVSSFLRKHSCKV